MQENVTHHHANVSGHGTHDTAIVDPRRLQMVPTRRQNTLSPCRFKHGLELTQILLYGTLTLPAP
jgi:hypothetical protein